MNDRILWRFRIKTSEPHVIVSEDEVEENEELILFLLLDVS